MYYDREGVHTFSYKLTSNHVGNTVHNHHVVQAWRGLVNKYYDRECFHTFQNLSHAKRNSAKIILIAKCDFAERAVSCKLCGLSIKHKEPLFVHMTPQTVLQLGGHQVPAEICYLVKLFILFFKTEPWVKEWEIFW